MARKQIPLLLTMLAVLILGIWLGPVMFDFAATALAPSRAIASPLEQEEPFSPDDMEAMATHACEVRSVTAGTAQADMQLICWNAASGGLIAFATRGADNGSNNALATALTAHALGRSVTVFYETAATGLPPGCVASNCRRILYLRMN